MGKSLINVLMNDCNSFKYFKNYEGTKFMTIYLIKMQMVQRNRVQN